MNVDQLELSADDIGAIVLHAEAVQSPVTETPLATDFHKTGHGRVPTPYYYPAT